MEDFESYMLSFETGSQLFINARSATDAAGDGLSALRACMPDENDLNPVIVRKMGDYCYLCGKAAKQFSIDVKVNGPPTKIRLCVGCARAVADAYEEV